MTEEIEVTISGGWVYGKGEYGDAHILMPDGTWKRVASYDRGDTLKGIIRDLGKFTGSSFGRPERKVLANGCCSTSQER